MQVLTIGVLALQGGFAEHLQSLERAAAARKTKPTSAAALRGGADTPGTGAVATGPASSWPPNNNNNNNNNTQFSFVEVRTPDELALCAALVIPGGESTTLSLVAAQSGLLEPLRDFVKKFKKPTWGTCAGLILLSEEASSTKRGGQELVGGLDVRVHRNHFGRQIESFVTDLELPFLQADNADPEPPFPAVFIRAPVVESLLATGNDDKKGGRGTAPPVEVLAVLPGRHANNEKKAAASQVGSGLHDEGIAEPQEGPGDIVALRQGNVFGMSFHPELTNDVRIHKWWLDEVDKVMSQAV
ncbi:class I glutamine amidotransferase-like protein [Microdochium trichocladiopsis]|uniref:glutaminase n=1 Tax=Microdochium trichocladiopsis TaxID=1682393 RepID=A0A9P9BRD0_9PEZI|nr:class I glutamine amidotransferase-like protein [Microdochium trichocladiopsis]KAH7035788.1 class I glutamine amidotransferase-like protein [Microdochium trichocladiopsis]